MYRRLFGEQQKRLNGKETMGEFHRSEAGELKRPGSQSEEYFAKYLVYQRSSGRGAKLQLLSHPVSI